jgi:hypothetical protein
MSWPSLKGVHARSLVRTAVQERGRPNGVAFVVSEAKIANNELEKVMLSLKIF